eukprot:400709_1
MLSFCVFRRFGLAVIINVLVIGCILELALDKEKGSGYYSDHLWAIGLNMFLSGIVTAIICFVTDRPAPTGGAHSPLLDIGEFGFSEKGQEAGGDTFRSHLDHFLWGSSEIDMFCYVPLNR